MIIDFMNNLYHCFQVLYSNTERINGTTKYERNFRSSQEIDFIFFPTDFNISFFVLLISNGIF